MTNILKLPICLFIVLVLSSCAITYKYGPFVGKVVDAQTGEPIEGAAVHIAFHVNSPNVAGGTSYYVSAVESLTDKNGEFNLSHRAMTFRLFSFWDKHPFISVFKPGYGTLPNHKKAIITPDPGYGSIEEGQYSIIHLPKLKTDKERLLNIRSSSLFVPLEDQKLFLSLENQERIYLGLTPYNTQKTKENMK